jgi:hypothetical protein
MKLAALYRQGATTASLHAAADGGFVAVHELAAAGAESQLTGLHDVRQFFERGPAAVGRLRELARGAEATSNESDVRYAPSVLAPQQDHLCRAQLRGPHYGK